MPTIVREGPQITIALAALHWAALRGLAVLGVARGSGPARVGSVLVLLALLALGAIVATGVVAYAPLGHPSP